MAGSLPAAYGNSGAPLGVDKNGNVFAPGMVYYDVNLPTVAAIERAAPNAFGGGFVARISPSDAPGIALGPGSLTFPNTGIGLVSGAQTVYVLAAGSQPLDITSITASANYKLASDNCRATLAGGSSCQVTVEFKPASSGTLSGYLTVVTNARTARALLSGVGVPVPIIAVSPQRLTFPATSVGTPSAPLVVTINSTGSMPLINNGISIGGTNSADFSETDDCPATLNPGQSCTVNVVMQPLADGSLTAALTINTNAVSGSVNPTLSGAGPTYTLSASPSSPTVSAGLSTASTITLTSEAGLTGTVKLGCSVPSGSGITCSFAPAKVTLAGSPANSTATISTSATTAGGSYKVIVYGSLTGLAAVFTPVTLGVTPKQGLTTLYSFAGSPDGVNPSAAVVLGSGGVLYGTTTYGGTANAGTVFSLTPPASASGVWTETVLYRFTGSPDGARPYAAAVLGSGGVLYGTTSIGGTANLGTVFSLTPPATPGGVWTESVLHSFTGGGDGEGPADLVIGGAGVLYGTTEDGGTANGGTVFELKPATGGSWTERILHSFPGTAGPNAVVIGAGGVLYGTTQQGGTSGSGTVFTLTPPASPGGVWTETVLYSFQSSGDGANPSAGVVIGSGGVLYGTTSNGGINFCSALVCGTVFSLTPPASPGGAWTESVLHSFTGFTGGGDGGNPHADLVIGGAGVLYGTTLGDGEVDNGTVFSLTPPASPGGVWTETVLHDFTGGSDGGHPYAGLVIGTSGLLYGTTNDGGNTTCSGGSGDPGCGTVFSWQP